MRLRNCVIVTTSDSKVSGGWKESHGNILITNNDLTALIKRRMHDAIDREFEDDTDETQGDRDLNFDEEQALLEGYEGNS